MAAKTSIKARAAWASCILTAVFLLLAGTAAFFLLTQALEKQNRQRACETARAAADAVKIRLAGETAWLETAAALPLETLAPLLQTAVSTHQALLSGQAAFADGRSYLAVTPAAADRQTSDRPAAHPEAADSPLNADWYQQTQRENRVLCLPGKPNEPIETLLLTTPMRDAQGAAIGALALEFDTAYLFSPLGDDPPPDTGYLLLVDQSGTILAATGQSPRPLAGLTAGQKLRDAAGSELWQTLQSSFGAEGLAPITGPDKIPRLFCFVRLPEAGWTVGYLVEPSALAALPPAVLFVFAGVCLLALAVVWGALYLLFGRFLRPVTRLGQMADRMTQGELSFDQPAWEIESGPAELGELAGLGNSLRKTCRLLKAYVDDIDHTLDRMARGDFTVKVAADYVGDFASIKTSINTISDSLHNVFVLIDSAARRTMGGSYQVSGASGRLTAGVTSQSGSVSTLADSMEELRRQIHESTAHANRANRSAKEVDEELRTLQLLNNQLCGLIDESRAAAIELVLLMNTLDNLSMQIGMLSINASAEAVRSGKQAYGFAVVADEIREFSTKSGVASRQASVLAARIRESGERGQQLAKVSSDGMRGLSEKSRLTAASVNFIAAAAELQSQAVNRVRKDVSGISAVVHSNAQVAEQCNSSSIELTQQAQNLANVLSAFYTKDSATNKVSAATRFSARDKDFIFYDFE